MDGKGTKRCIYCERMISQRNSPTQFDVYGEWIEQERYPPICDECLDRLSRNKRR